MYVICWGGGGITGKVWLGSKCLIEIKEAEVKVSKLARFDVDINRDCLLCCGFCPLQACPGPDSKGLGISHILYSLWSNDTT